MRIATAVQLLELVLEPLICERGIDHTVNYFAPMRPSAVYIYPSQSSRG